jgi:hypothetical protein
MEHVSIRGWIYKYLWLICLVTGLGGFVFIYFFRPHTPEMNSIGEYLLRIFIFMILSSSAAFFPNQSKRGYLWLIAPILIYAGWIGGKLDYIGFRQLMNGVDAGTDYYIALYLILYPFILFCINFSYRIGGGTSGNCIKLSFTGVLILFSGFLDVMFELTNPVVIPEVIPYDYYFRVYFGHFPTYQEEVIFCLSHLPVIIGFLCLPLDKWINTIFAKKKENPASMLAETSSTT